MEQAVKNRATHREHNAIVEPWLFPHTTASLKVEKSKSRMPYRGRVAVAYRFRSPSV
jgi:hypothetical protein